MIAGVVLRPSVPLGLLLAAAGVLVVVCAWRAWAERREPGQRGAWVLRAFLVLAALGVLVRPGLGQVPAQARVSDLEVLVVVDRTASMSAQDWDGDTSRLAGVRADLAEVTARLAGSRFALVTFGKVVRTELPFTSDVAAFTSGVETLRREDIFSGGGSLVDRPIEAMQELLTTAEEQHPERRRLVLLLTDGENTASGEQRSFADLAPLVDGGAVLGYGTEAGGRMPSDDPEDPDSDPTYESWIFDEATGEDALSKLDLDNLQTVADQLGVPMAQRERPGGLDDLLDGLAPTLSDDDSELPAEHEVAWVVALLLAALALLDLRRSWRSMHAARREATGR